MKVSDDVIACDLWFGPPPIKNPGYAYDPEQPVVSDDMHMIDFRSCMFLIHLTKQMLRLYVWIRMNPPSQQKTPSQTLFLMHHSNILKRKNSNGLPMYFQLSPMLCQKTLGLHVTDSFPLSSNQSSILLLQH